MFVDNFLGLNLMKPINIGLLGFGVVGSGTWKVLNQNVQEIARRAGRKLQITMIAVRNTDRVNAVVGDKAQITLNGLDVVNNPDIDIVVELIGGSTTAKDWILQAIANDKHVVTANKALLANHGNEIFAAAESKGVMVAYEAAVAGGIPIIKAIREGLSANHIQWIAGIINGTTNFILSEMRNRGLPFDEVLSEAQRLGFAEADPTFDIEGVDAAHKLSLLASVAFGIPVQFSKVYTEGISNLSSQDIDHAERLGYRIKLLGITKKTEQGIELRVHPTLVPFDCLLSNVEGAMNAVLVYGDAVGPTLYYGQGAGDMPTASAVVADLVDVARLHSADPDHRVPYLAFQSNAMSDTPVLDMSKVESSYYLRMRVHDQPGVLSELSRILADADISIGSMFQHPLDNEQANIIFLTHKATEGHIDSAIHKIKSLPFVLSKVTRLRVEDLI